MQFFGYDVAEAVGEGVRGGVCGERGLVDRAEVFALFGGRDEDVVWFEVAEGGFFFLGC